MGAQMLKSQLAALEDPSEERGVYAVNIDQEKEAVGDEAARGMREVIKRETGETNC